MTPKTHGKARRPAGPTPPKADYSRELRDSEYLEVVQESARMTKTFKVIDAIKL